MRISSDGLALIEQFEGFSAKPYICPSGWLTIGYGHVIREHEKDALAEGISEAQAEALLKQDISYSERAVSRLIEVGLSQGRFDALVSFTFNLGAGALQRSTLRRKINRQLHLDVPQELMKWVWGGGRKLPGLVRRRIAESHIYSKSI